MFYTSPLTALWHVHTRMNQTLLDTGALLQRVYAGLSLYMTYYVYGFCMILIKGIQCCNVIKFFKHSDFDLCLLAFKMDL
jgi:hypothetical protein